MIRLKATTAANHEQSVCVCVFNLKSREHDFPGEHELGSKSIHLSPSLFTRIMWPVNSCSAKQSNYVIKDINKVAVWHKNIHLSNFNGSLDDPQPLTQHINFELQM